MKHEIWIDLYLDLHNYKNFLTQNVLIFTPNLPTDDHITYFKSVHFAHHEKW